MGELFIGFTVNVLTSKWGWKGFVSRRKNMEAAENEKCWEMFID